MRRVSILLATLTVAGCSGTPAARTANPADAHRQKPQLGEFGIDLSARDPGVPAGDDFFRHANGQWLDSYELKPDEPRYGSFIELRYQAEEQVRAIIDELAAGKHAVGSIEQKVADYYGSYMDVEGRDRSGLSPLQEDLDRIDAIADMPALVTAFGRVSLDGSNAPFEAHVDIDSKNPDRYILRLGQSGLGLPDRDYYLEQTERFQSVREAYEAHISTMLQLTGWDAERSSAAARRVCKLETAIAKHHWPRTDMRDADKTYNLYSVEKLVAEFPGYDWLAHLRAMEAGTPKEIVVSTPTAITPLVALVASTPLDTWKEYLRFHMITSHAEYLSSTIDDASFAFFGKVLSGQQAQRDRWKRAVNLVGAQEGLGEALGQLYVRKHFPPASKAMMRELVENLRKAFGERIRALDWMGQETKEHALAKLASFNPKIGYPDEWKDLSGITIKPDSLLENVKAVRAFFHAFDMARLDRPTDKNEWFMTPHTVNAYYNPAFNEIVFPAAILQPPFFDPNADAAVNYGAIGAVIGHEMGHGFDDQGSKFDSTGVQRNWWTDEDRARFEARTQALVAQYNTYTPLPGQHVDGDFTQGENIGDLGGLSIAYHAYRISLQGKRAPVLGEFTGDQRFFLSWSQVWRSKSREEYLVSRLKSDPHSPEQFRVNGVVRNMDAWYNAFQVQPGQGLHLPSDQRVSIW